MIEPFDQKALGNVSFDLTLGDTIARYLPERGMVDLGAEEPRDMFKLERADLRFGVSCPGFYLAAGERVLGHSREIAGGRAVASRCIWPRQVRT